MTRHLLTLIWNRRRANALVMIEIFFSFVVLFGVAAASAYFWNNSRLPLGYSIRDVWAIEVRRDASSAEEGRAEATMETARQLYAVAREFPEIESVAGSYTVPYGNSRWGSSAHDLTFGINEVTDAFRETMGLEIVRGRWFGPGDDGTPWKSTVINERLAHAFFGADDPIGRVMPDDPPVDGQPRTERRVVGVVRDYREDGELAAPGAFAFYRRRLDAPSPPPSVPGPPTFMVVRVRPGTGAAFEETLVKRLQGVAPDWSFEVQTLDQLRDRRFRVTLAPLLVVGVVSGFLMLMVVLGLTGVVWQNVTQRTREIGLRRAKGAAAGAIQRQIVGELVVMASVSLAVGVALAVQLPLLQLIPAVTPIVYAEGLAVSIVAIYVLTIVCGWYPSRLAIRVEPAEALHHE